VEGPLVGTLDRNGYFSGSSADAAVIDMPAVEADDAVYTNGTYQVITNVQPLNLDYFGEPVCHSGIASETHCGMITNTDATVTYGSAILYHQRESDVYAYEGDSGGPVFYGSTAIGTVSGITCSSTCNANDVTGTIYSQIVNDENAMGVSVYTP
jgi:hypothetical protein